MHIWSHWVKTCKIGVHYAGEVEAFNPSMVREGSGLSIVITSDSNRYTIRILKQKKVLTCNNSKNASSVLEFHYVVYLF